MIYHVSRQEIINSNQLTKNNFIKLNSKHIQYSLKIGLIILYVYRETNIKHPLTKIKRNKLITTKQTNYIHKRMSLCNTLRHLLNIDVSSAHETSALKIVRYIVPNLRSTVRPRLYGLMQRKCAN